jgi:hypothetical protein
MLPTWPRSETTELHFERAKRVVGYPGDALRDGERILAREVEQATVG